MLDIPRKEYYIKRVSLVIWQKRNGMQANKRLTIPTVEEVLAFGNSIGVSGVTIAPGYEQWWNVLHEIGHFAVKPDGYIALKETKSLNCTKFQKTYILENKKQLALTIES